MFSKESLNVEALNMKIVLHWDRKKQGYCKYVELNGKSAKQIILFLMETFKDSTDFAVTIYSDSNDSTLYFTDDLNVVIYEETENQ